MLNVPQRLTTDKSESPFFKMANGSVKLNHDAGSAHNTECSCYAEVQLKGERTMEKMLRWMQTKIGTDENLEPTKANAPPEKHMHLNSILYSGDAVGVALPSKCVR